MVLKPMKIEEDVKEDLDSIKYYENESYTSVIKRLIEENKQLKEDKTKLFELLINKDDLDIEGTNTEKVYSFLLATDNIKTNEEEVELQVLEIYLQDIIKTDPASVIEAVDMLIKTTVNEKSISTLEKFKNYVKTSS